MAPREHNGSLLRFASSKAPSFNKAAVQKKAELGKFAKLAKRGRVRDRLAKQGKLVDGVVTDNVGGIESMFFTGEDKPPPQQQQSFEGEDGAASQAQGEAGRAQEPPLGSKAEAGPPSKRARPHKLPNPHLGQQQGSGQQPAGKGGQQRPGQGHQQPWAGKEAVKTAQTGLKQGDQETHGNQQGQKKGKASQGLQQLEKASGKGKPVSTMQRMIQQVDARKAEQQADKQQAVEASAQRQKTVQAAQKNRQEESKKYYKRNRKGQPLMRYRMESILMKLQSEQRPAVKASH